MLLTNVLDSKNKLKLLRELCLNENWEYSVNELSKNAGIHRVLVSKLIKELNSSNIIRIKNKGKTKLISINQDNCFVAEILIELFKKERDFPIKLAQDFADRLKHDTNIVSIILYGSASKNKLTFKSDIDIMIITKAEIRNKSNIEKMAEDFAKIGVLIMYDTITLSEFKKAYAEKESAIVSIVKDNKLLYGKSILEVI